MDYKPRPIDTSQIKLSEDILGLTELLARSTHDIWAQQRLAEGWRYGAERDDKRLEHPGLVPYEELSEAEKGYDRNTALETLKSILSLGYRIEPPARAAHTHAAPGDAAADSADALLKTLKQPGALTLDALLAVWQARDALLWARSAEIYQHLGARLLQLGEMLLAYDVVSEGLKFWPDDLRLRQQQAHALTRLGATTRANRLLLALYAEGARDEETVGLLARTHKDLWQQAATDDERERQLQQSYKYYEEAYRLSGGYWTGINAATIALLSGRSADARTLAAEVRQMCLVELQRIAATGGDRYWMLATLGEAALVSEDWTEAARRYDEALTDGRGQPGEVASTRRNARLIIEYLGGDPAFIEQHLPVPKVVVFDGREAAHRNEPERQVSAGKEAELRQFIFERLNALGAGVGYANVPAPGDTSFLEAMFEAGGETHAVLPCELSELLKAERGDDDRSDASGEVQAERAAHYESVLKRVTSIVAASEQNMASGGMSEEYSRLLLQGLASIRARQLDTELVTLAFPEEAAANVAATPDASGVAPEVQIVATDGFNAQMAALLFADAVNFSKLTEAQIPVFVEHFLGAVGSLVARFQPAPLLRNTWGDGLYFVFSDVGAAGRFALDLSDILNATDWTQHNLPAELNLRIALHAGPVYACKDPVTERPNFIGSHVNRAARLEPVTPPGQVYASQAFAALATAARIADFTCDYVGQMPLAKKFGTFPTYHVRRKRGSRNAER